MTDNASETQHEKKADPKSVKAPVAEAAKPKFKLPWIQPATLPEPAGVLQMGKFPVVVTVQHGDTKKDAKSALKVLESFCDLHNLQKHFDDAVVLYARPLGHVGFFVSQNPMERQESLKEPDVLLLGIPFQPAEFKRDYQESLKAAEVV